jgi:uncharacterized membrane protein YfcA
MNDLLEYLSYQDAILLFVVGIISAFLNVLAGGGSLLSLPLMIFMGLPSAAANATNRVAMLVQNIVAVKGFHSKGVFVYPYALWAGLSATVGAGIGAYLATIISDKSFNRLLAVVMVMVVVATLFGNNGNDKKQEDFSKAKVIGSVLSFFFIGIYGGFIQAGIGFLMIASLLFFHNLGMAKVNSIKVFVTMIYTVVVLAVFIYYDLVWWSHGLVLAAGNGVGAWFTSRWSVSVPDRVIRAILIVMVAVLSVKLWLFES